MKVTFIKHNKGVTVIDNKFIHIDLSIKIPGNHDLLSVNDNIQRFYAYFIQIY